MPWADVAILAVAFLFDRFVGEWPGAIHPVVAMGRAVRALERFAPTTPRRALLFGAGMALGLPLLSAGLAAGLVALPWVGPVFAIFLLKSSFALRLLGEAGAGVQRPLDAGDLEEGRRRLGWLCSRDASALGPAELVAGTIESLAENLSDSFVAPLFWFAIGGVPAAIAYRMVNTLDAMIGYHGRYEWLGKASARLDDLANLLPARLTTLLLLLAAPGTRADTVGGVSALRRFRRATESPNAGWPMSAIAGLLGVRLSKPGCYTLGDGRAPLPADIPRAWRVCSTAAHLGLALLFLFLRVI